MVWNKSVPRSSNGLIPEGIVRTLLKNIHFAKKTKNVEYYQNSYGATLNFQPSTC